MIAREVQADATHERAAEQAPERTRSELDELMLNMETLEPGDHKFVAMLLEQHPEFRDAIIAKAQEVCGNDTVAKALEMLSKPKPQPKAAGDSASSETAATPAPDKTGETVASAKQGGKQAAEDFVWITSYLALEYDYAERIRDHVEFIRKNPHLRDKVIAGAAEFEPDLARDVEKALRGEAPAEASATATSASGSTASTTPADQAGAKQFDYFTSFLALEYDHEEKVKEHVEFIRANPHLRDQVLIGAAKFDPELAEEVRQRLANPTPAENETEPTPPKVVAEEAADSAPASGGSRSKKASAEEATTGETKSDKAEPGWVRRARIWNAKHKEEVKTFLQITGSVCLDADGNLDPRLVARWQAAHGTPPDGRVGSDTVTAAMLSMPWENEAVAQETQGATAPNST